MGLAQAERSEDVAVPIVDVSTVMFSRRDATSGLRRQKQTMSRSETMIRLITELYEQFAESKRVEDEIRKNMKGLGDSMCNWNSLRLVYAMCCEGVTLALWVGHTLLDTLSDACYNLFSIPIGPLPQGMLSLGGFLFPPSGGLT